jgi:S-DNA-T family DNA segregation ATPase FtsK/SpoIIIE
MAAPIGIHLILASSEPSCLRGLRDSFPVRACLKVASPTDSKILLGESGGEHLLRKRSLYFLDGNDPDVQLLQCGLVTSREVRNIADALKSNYVNVKRQSIFDEIEEDHGSGGSRSGKGGGLFSRLKD